MEEPDIEGVGTSTFQDSPLFCPDSQWGKDGWQTKIPEADRPGLNSNLFELYKTAEGRQEVISRLKKLNVTMFRFSVEWSHLEPKEGEWKEENMQFYINLCRDLRDSNIEPMVTLLHFSEPNHVHANGSFEKEENIGRFAHFAEKVFDHLTKDYKGRPLVEWFCTINEPAIDAFSRYVVGTFSPGLIMNFEKAGHFLKNALKAHCVVYNALKKKNLPSVKVGIIHQYLRLRPTNFLLIPILRCFNRLINEAPMNFFRTKGTFELKVPFRCNIYEETGLDPKTDFIGTQFYARAAIGPIGSTSFGEPMTMMPFLEDPAGIYEAIEETHKAFNAPVLVTETGISTDEDEQRNRFMRRIRYAMREAVKDFGKENVLGMSWWCFGDNMELERGMRQRFGLFPLTKKGLSPDPKEGVKPSIEIAKAWRARQKTPVQKEKIV